MAVLINLNYNKAILVCSRDVVLSELDEKRRSFRQNEAEATPFMMVWGIEIFKALTCTPAEKAYLHSTSKEELEFWDQQCHLLHPETHILQVRYDDPTGIPSHFFVIAIWVK